MSPAADPALSRVGLERVVCCARCGKPIATWDGEYLIVQRPAQRVFVQIPGGRAVIQCPRRMSQNGQKVACGYVNRVRVSEG